MKIAQSKTREEFPLSTKKVLKKTLTGSLLCIILLILSLISLVLITKVLEKPSNLFTLITVGIVVFAIVIIALVYLYQMWYYSVYFYDLAEDFIVIRKGPITPSEITIPYERVQDVYVDQDVLDRIFGLYDVHLSSATVSSGMEAHIDGVEKVAADGLREKLLKTVGSRISRKV